MPLFNLFIVISYSLGFATGTYIGGVISKKIINSKYTVQIITDYNVQLLINYIRESSMAVSILKLEGKNKNKYMLFVDIDSKYYKSLYKIIKSVDENAFIVVNEAILVHNGYFGENK